MKLLSFTEALHNNSFADLIRALAQPDSANDINIDPQIGSGTIHCLELEPGLQVRVWDCTITNGLQINRESNPLPEQRSLTLVYYLTPDSYLLEDSEAGNYNSVWNTAIISSNASIRIKILPGKPLRCLSINFSPEWFRKNILPELDQQQHILSGFIQHPDPFVLFESYSQQEEELILSVFDQLKQAKSGKFFLLLKTLNLVQVFLSKISHRCSAQTGMTLFHERQVEAAEKMLMENLHDNLPNLKQLAGKLAIGESTLKRYFRKRYGKNIYRYFIEKKMAVAREMLQHQKITVTEVAFRVGYEKAGRFSRVFKKFYGILPGHYAHLNLSSRQAV